MTERDLFERVGATLWGPLWVAPMAEALGVSERSVRYWRAGVRPIPDGVWDDLYGVAERRIAEIHAITDEIGGAPDEREAGIGRARP